jgi:hypothetical protein
MQHFMYLFHKFLNFCSNFFNLVKIGNLVMLRIVILIDTEI